MNKKKIKKILKKIVVSTLIIASFFILTVPLNLIALFISMNYIETNKFYLATSVISLIIIFFCII